MFQYDEELKLRSLTIYGFDIEKLDISKIEHVPMHQYRVSTKIRPLLYIDNLQCCIGLYAYGNNFGFAAHINPLIMRGDEYELDENKKAVRCKRIEDLKNIILKSNSYDEVINIGICIGCTPLKDDYYTVKMLNENIDLLIKELNLINIKVNKLENQCFPEFILDTVNKKLILPCNNQKIR